MRAAASTLLVVALLGLAACGDSGDNAVSQSCLTIGEVGAALNLVRASEGDTAAASASFDAASTAFGRTSAPAELTVQWSIATEALRYYSAAAGSPDTPRRSESEVQRWQEAFSQITDLGIDQCGLGWRTPFDDCLQGTPPEGAAKTRLLFPCAL